MAPGLRLRAPQCLPKEPVALSGDFCSWKQGHGARSTLASDTGRPFPPAPGKALHQARWTRVPPRRARDPTSRAPVPGDPCFPSVHS